MLGATIMLSNFGTIAGRYASPVVVPPCVAILGAGVIYQRVVAVADKLESHRFLPLSLSFDHRPITGGDAGRFLLAIKTQLEKAGLKAGSKETKLC
jgi:pyruvate dehydrogenase E2 component (dihydrolipoamide acetyltransferase)